MTNQVVSLSAAGAQRRAQICGSCRGPLSANDPVCQRCGADNIAWLQFQSSHFQAFRMREVLALTSAAFVMVALIVVGYGLFVVLGTRVWDVAVGAVLLVASLPLAGVGFWFAWSDRERHRQSLHMPGMGFRAQMLLFARRTLILLVLSLVAALAGPLFMFITPWVLDIGSKLFGLAASVALPEITRGTYVLMFLMVWYFYMMHVAGEALGNAAAREYALAANAVAPPLIFERQEKFHELCKQAVLNELAAIVDPKKVKWLKLERADDGGMAVQVSVPHIDEVVEKINEFNYERVPHEKKYDVRLDRWARLTSIALVTENT